MAIAGVDTQGGSQLTALRNFQQPDRTDETRTQEAREARFGANDTSETEARQDRFGTESSPPPGQGQGQGTSVPGTSLDNQSLSALIQATQEQDTQSAQAASQDEERQEEASAANSTNSLVPGASEQSGTGSGDGRGVSFLV
ncbi:MULTISPECIES: hypothetical protein [Thalassobaculum]|uniref:Uncharacterized protein n=1 Tax=Thalassobaculum litoreum DSM 18839 TaxID=1123362 RepID=A0A8G2BE87_9PROT|nr:MULTISPECIES: hypothetical protein [Thalassobaculum]SDF11186.1 hypothetical protein SAMN05660686_00302 [Thalassobaculum litoreum DSM 18839]